MNIAKILRKPGTLAIAVAMTSVSFQAPVMADMIDSAQLVTQAELTIQRDDVRSFMARDDVRSAMLDYGVSAADVDARINGMTQGELLQLQNQLGQLPAGGNGAVGIVLAIILIFVLLDVLGATDIFPNI